MNDWTRRGFLAAGALAAASRSGREANGNDARQVGNGKQVQPKAASVDKPKAAPPSEKIVLGFIGVGGMGTGLLNTFKGFPDVAIAAVCDVHEPHRDRARSERFRAALRALPLMPTGPTAQAGAGGRPHTLVASQAVHVRPLRSGEMRSDEPHPLARLAGGAPATWFLAHDTPKAAYKAWIAGSLDPQGALQIDSGALRALELGKSLLPAGVVDVRGKFEKGDAVRILGPTGMEIGRGLARYDAEDARKIKGLKSTDIEAALGYAAGAALVHADDLVLIGR